MNVKEETFSALEDILASVLENASKTLELKKKELEKKVLPKVRKMKVYDKNTQQQSEVSIYRDVMFREEYVFENKSVVRESGIVFVNDFELAKLEIVHLKEQGNNGLEEERAYLCEIELSDIPMLALFIESVEIDLSK
ncbi:hypothetical protein [Mesoaciditoga sp.]